MDCGGFFFFFFICSLISFFFGGPEERCRIPCSVRQHILSGLPTTFSRIWPLIIIPLPPPRPPSSLAWIVTGAFWLVSLLASSSPAIFQAQRLEWPFPNVSLFRSVPCTGPCNGFASSWNKSQKPSIWLPAAFWGLPCLPQSLPSIADLSGCPCSCQACPPRPSLALAWSSLIPNICRAYPSTPFLFLLRKTFTVSFSLLFLLP